MKLEFIPCWDMDEHWAEVAPMLSRALAKQSAMSIESVYQDVKRGKFHLWRIPKHAALITEVQQFPKERICMIVLCGGEELDQWMVMADETLSRYAKALGCVALMIVGRKGWNRVLPKYEIQDVVMRKAL